MSQMLITNAKNLVSKLCEYDPKSVFKKTMEKLTMLREKGGANIERGS